MKHIIVAIALFVATVPALAQTPQIDRTQEYRMWSAEQVVNRLVERYGKVAAGHPVLTSIRETATIGDDVLWVQVVDEVRKFEALHK